MLLWCVLTTALARGVDPVTTFDYTGDWDVGGKALITIARDARGVLVVRVNVPNEADDAFKAYLDQTSITLIESDQTRRRDAADLIGEQSVYRQPGAPLVP